MPVKPRPRNLSSVMASLPTRDGNLRAINGTVMIQSMYRYSMETVP